MFLEEDKALKIWPISICVRGIEKGLKQPPLFTVNSGSLLSSGRTDMLSMQLNCFFQLIAAAQSTTIIHQVLLNNK